MRDMRVAHNADLASVATSLRIRQVYLQAIEDGRFDDLPGPTYASGFVRAYAEYLGLDIGEVMRRYRDITRGGGAQAPLVAPSPVSEGRMPTGFILLVAAVLAAVAYGSWYYLTLHERDAGEIVARLPQRIADMVGLNSAAEGPVLAAPEREAAAPPRAAPPPARSAPVPRAAAPTPEERVTARPIAPERVERSAEPPPPAGRDETAAEAPQPAAVEAASARQAPAEESPPSAPAVSAADEATPSASLGAPPPADSAEPVAEAVSPTQAETAEPEPEPAPESATALASAPAIPPAPPAASRATEAGRVVLRATAISWVELRDADGRRVFSRLLKKGETYNVPPQRGITLATGNAGALDILVDGQAVEPIGPVGAVRRDILLEPDALRDGPHAGQ